MENGHHCQEKGEKSNILTVQFERVPPPIEISLGMNVVSTEFRNDL